MFGTKVFGLIAALLCVAAAPAPQLASAATSNSSEATAPASLGPAQAQPLPEKKVCKALPTTGTRMVKRACLTADEWKKLEADLNNE